MIQDAEARRVAAALLAGEDPDGDDTDPAHEMRAVFRDGLVPALQTDAVVLRAFVRNLNMLSEPDALMSDTDVSARVFAAWEQRHDRPAPDPIGPATREEFLAAADGLTSTRASAGQSPRPVVDDQSTASRSTTNTSVSFGAITPPAPDAP